CLGAYEERQIAHTVRVRGQVMVVDHVPAKVCDTCGDTLLSLDTIRRLDAVLRDEVSPSATAPLYEYESLAVS
ncbi:MAG: YgiT-type zinc finger protein, partial [Candidatus Tectomicrobia bacterium]|nr:YgiT-type zinc finger protein [Candidatus Tectomicrobia bacterium]